MACFGVALICAGEADEGRKRIEEAIGQEPEMESFAVASCLRTADARAAVGEDGSAIQLYETALGMDPSDSTAVSGWGVYGNADDLRGPRLYRDLIRSDPGSPGMSAAAVGYTASAFR